MNQVFKSKNLPKLNKLSQIRKKTYFHAINFKTWQPRTQIDDSGSQWSRTLQTALESVPRIHMGEAEKCWKVSPTFLQWDHKTKLHWDAWVQNKMHYFVLIHEIPLELPKCLLPTKIWVNTPQTLAIKELWNAVSFPASALQEHTRKGGVEWRLSESVCTIHYCSWYNSHISHNLSLWWLNIHMHLPLNNSCCFLSFLTIMTIYPC